MRADLAGFFILNPKSYNDPERQPARFRSLRDGPRSGLKRDSRQVRSRRVRSRGCRFFCLNTHYCCSVGADPSTALRDPVAKAFDLIGRCDLL